MSAKRPCADCGKPCTGTRCRPCNAKIPARERSGDYGKFELHPSHLITGPTPTGHVMDDEAARAAVALVVRRVPPAEVDGVLAMLGLTPQAVAA